MKTITLIAAASMALTTAFAQAPATSQETAPQAPHPPCQEEVFRDFDFWLGEWEVYSTKDKKAGTNKITSHEQGCLIIENWTNNAGTTGQSYNFYDPGIEKWRQVWVSAGIVIDYAGGLNDAGEMVLEGEIRYHNGTKAPFRGIWTPLSDGNVRQHFDQYDSEKEEWAPWFTGIYKKQSAD